MPLLNRTLAGAVLAGVALSTGVLLAQSQPHANHEPHHGGLMRPAAGDRLHVEGVWSEQRRFRMIILDASGSPLPIERLRDIEARVVAGDREAPLALLETEGSYEARIPTLPLPARITVRLRASKESPVEALQFDYDEYSRDAEAADSPIEIPATLPAILDRIGAQQREAHSALERGDFAAVSTAEGHVLDLVLATEPYVAGLAGEPRRRVERARAAAVRASWLLHTAIDAGTPLQARAAFDVFARAIDDLAAAFAGGSR